ncbi:hypothetical protein CRM22_007898 [Opisthorchis felineus]|uniref:Uncharacterized protein n=1 Tax=Opisthorchis felineus TaxID=147828 RepID=A0A4S2LFW8_OPIFE|nr:hypothetical protein CRM22_007898 [Opisthorchis felineus]
MVTEDNPMINVGNSERELNLGNDICENVTTPSDRKGNNNSSPHIGAECESPHAVNQNILHNGVYTGLDNLTQKLCKLQKDVLVAVSNTERVEALRQASELELARANLANKNLHQTCERQQKLLGDTSDELKATKERYEATFNEVINNWREAKRKWTERESELLQDISYLTGTVKLLLKDGQLEKLHSLLPRVVEGAVTKAVETVHSVAKSQLSKANGRLELAEQRLEQQMKRLRELELANQYLKERLAQNEPNDVQPTLRPAAQSSPMRYESIVQICPAERMSGKAVGSEDSEQVKLLAERWNKEQKWLGGELERIALKLEQTIPAVEAKSEKVTGTKIVRKRPKSSSTIQEPPTSLRETNLKRKSGPILRQNIRRVEKIPDNLENITDGLHKLETLISKISDALESKSPQPVASSLHLREDLEAMKNENQHLRKRLAQLESQSSLTEANRSRTSSCQPAPRSLRSGEGCCHVMPKSNASSVQALEARFFQARREAERWRRKWKEQQLELQIQRERLETLKVNQKADQQLRQEFLHSVCQLVQQASRHIDRVVQKHLCNWKEGSVQPTKAPASTCHVPPDSTKRRKKAYIPSAMDPVMPSAQTPSKKSDVRFDPTGDGQSIHSKELSNSSEKWADRLLPGSQDILSSGQNGFEVYPHTNCNNNVGVSSSPTRVSLNHFTEAVTPQGTSHGCREMELHGWSEIHQALAEEFTNELSCDTVTKRVDDGPSEDDRSIIDSVATTSDRFGSEDPSEVKNSSSFREYPEGNEQTLLDDSAPKAQSRSMSAYSGMSLGNDHTDLHRWNDLRAAVRYELGRVVANVLEQAKQQDSLAQECLEAITELHLQITNPSLGPLEPHSRILTAEHIDQPLEWTPASGESNCRNAQLFQHLAHITRMRDTSPPIGRDPLIGPAAIRIAAPPALITPPMEPTVLATPEIISEPHLVTASPPCQLSVCNTPSDTHPLVPPLPSLELRAKRPEPEMVEKVKRKVAGGVIHPASTRTVRPSARRSSGLVQLIAKKDVFESTSSEKVNPRTHNDCLSATTSCVPNCLPSILRCAVGDKPNGKTEPATIKDMLRDQANTRSSQLTHSTLLAKPKGVRIHSCVLPPLGNSQYTSGDNYPTKRQRSAAYYCEPIAPFGRTFKSSIRSAPGSSSSSEKHSSSEQKRPTARRSGPSNKRVQSNESFTKLHSNSENSVKKASIGTDACMVVRVTTESADGVHANENNSSGFPCSSPAHIGFDSLYGCDYTIPQDNCCCGTACCIIDPLD